MQWTSDTARAQYEEIQGRLASLIKKIEKAAAEAGELERQATRLIDEHTLPFAGSYSL